MLFLKAIKRGLDLRPPGLKAFFALFLYFTQFLFLELHGHTGVCLVALWEIFEGVGFLSEMELAFGVVEGSKGG
jgi:hypothetical protein